MKKFALLIALVLFVCAPANGQNLLKKLGDRAKEAVEQNLGDKVETGVNDLLNGKTKDKKDKQKPVKLGVFEWLFPWPPVYRLAPMEEAIDSNTIDIVTFDGISFESDCE